MRLSDYMWYDCPDFSSRSVSLTITIYLLDMVTPLREIQLSIFYKTARGYVMVYGLGLFFFSVERWNRPSSLQLGETDTM